MQPKLYNLIFRGEITGQYNQETVIRNLAVLFKKDPQSMAKLFTGEKFTLSRDLGLEAARKYQTLLKKAGAIVSLDEQGSGPAKGAAPIPQRTDKTTTKIAGAAADSMNRETTITGERGIDHTGLSMSEPGVTIIEPITVPEPVINTDTFSLSPAGATLVEQHKQPVFDKTIGQFGLAPPGEMLSKEKPPQKADIDTSRLSLDPRNPAKNTQ